MPPGPEQGQMAAANGSRVLVVNQEPPMRKAICEALARAGLRCLEAANGESGLSLAATRPVSAAVVALDLPGMSGLELAWRLHQESPALGIVGVSDYVDLWDAEGLRDFGIRQVLSAPFVPGELSRAICDGTAAGKTSAHLGSTAGDR